MKNPKHHLPLIAARVIAFLWAGGWMGFGIASSFGEGLRLGGVLMHVLFPGALFITIALFAWRWPLHGGVVLMLCGVAVLTAYPLFMGGRFPFRTVAFLAATMGVPPLWAGLMMFLDARKHRPTFPFKTED